MNTTSHDIPEIRRLQRSRSDRKVAGVSGGLAQYFEIHPASLPRRLRRSHPARWGRHPHLRGRGPRDARRGQGGLDRDGCSPQPAGPAVAADRARAPRGRRSHPPVTRHPVAERRLLVPVPDRGRRDPLDHAPARSRSHRRSVGRSLRRPHRRTGVLPGAAREARLPAPAAAREVGRDHARDAHRPRAHRRRRLLRGVRRRPRQAASATATSRSRASRTCRAATSSASARSTSISAS